MDRYGARFIGSEDDWVEIELLVTDAGELLPDATHHAFFAHALWSARPELESDAYEGEEPWVPRTIAPRILDVTRVAQWNELAVPRNARYVPADGDWEGADDLPGAIYRVRLAEPVSWVSDRLVEAWAVRDTWLRSPDAISLTFAPADDAHPPSLPVSRDAVFNVAQALGATMIERGRSAINAQELVLRFADGSQVELDVVLELDDDAFDLDDERLDDARAVAWRTGRTGWNNTIDGSPARVAAVLDSLVEDLGPIVVSAMFRDPVVVDGRRPWIDAFL